MSLIVWKVKYPLCFVASLLHSSINQELFKNSSVIKVATVKSTDDFHYAKEAIMCMQMPNQHILLSAKTNGTQRSTLVSPWKMHCTYCGVPKSTSQAEVISNSEFVPFSHCWVMLVWNWSLLQLKIPNFFVY